MKKLFTVILSILLLLIWSAPVFAATDNSQTSGSSGTSTPSAASDLTPEANFTGITQSDYISLSDDRESTYCTFKGGTEVTVSASVNIAHIYIEFYTTPVKWAVSAAGKNYQCGKDGYLHEYVDIEGALGETNTISFTFEQDASVCYMRLYSHGELPEDVQVWNAPWEKADILMYSSHSDDEQLFFAGVLPYSVAYGARAQVVYFCDHSATPARPHEQLNGLWAAGVRNYPVFGIFPDLYSESLEGAESAFGAHGYTDNDFMTWQVENLRRFQPQVVLGHDINGEYGHGTHVLNSKTLRQAVEEASDSGKYPESAQKYGVWDVPKLYLHLYAENSIVMDFDSPLDYFGGKTAFQMSCAGYECHYSQHWTWFTGWLYGTENSPVTKASDIQKYNPCEYGLWRSLVGPDTKADFFDNIVLYSEQERLAEESRAESEAEESRRNTTYAESVTETHEEENSTETSKVLPVILFAAIAAAIAAVTVIVLKRRGRKSLKSTVKSDVYNRPRNGRTPSEKHGSYPSYQQTRNQPVQRRTAPVPERTANAGAKSRNSHISGNSRQPQTLRNSSDILRERTQRPSDRPSYVQVPHTGKNSTAAPRPMRSDARSHPEAGSRTEIRSDRRQTPKNRNTKNQ